MPVYIEKEKTNRMLVVINSVAMIMIAVLVLIIFRLIACVEHTNEELIQVITMYAERDNTEQELINIPENDIPEMDNIDNTEIDDLPVETETIVTENPYSEIKMSPDEYKLLASIVALEAKNQPDIGQRAVIEVIFNRVVDEKRWDNTVNDVLMAKGQFSSVKYLKNPYAVPEEKEYENIKYVLEHGRTILPEGYVYFATYAANGTDSIYIQDHCFNKG